MAKKLHKEVGTMGHDQGLGGPFFGGGGWRVPPIYPAKLPVVQSLCYSNLI